MKKDFNLPPINAHIHAAMIGFRGVAKGGVNFLAKCNFSFKFPLIFSPRSARDFLYNTTFQRNFVGGAVSQ